jgi:hypothetical protein
MNLCKHFCLIFSISIYSAFGTKRDKITGQWIKLHNEELNDLYSSRNIIRVIKSRRMRLAGHVACLGEREVYTGV